MTDETSWRYNGWRVTGVCFAVAAFSWSFGFFGQSVYLAELQHRFGWSASLLGVLTSYYLTVAAGVMYVSDIIGCFGPRLTLLTGSVLLASAMILLAFVAQPWQLIPVYGVMATGMAATHMGAISNIVGLWFTKRRKLALTIALTGGSVGGLVLVPALVRAIGAFGFEAAMWGAALLGMTILLAPIACAVGEPPPRPDIRRPALTRASLLRSFSFWAVALPFSLALTAQVGFLAHQIAFLTPVIGRDNAGLAVGLAAGGALVGRLLLGCVAERVDLRLITAAFVLSQATGLLAMTQTANVAALLLASMVVGAGAGPVAVLPSMIIQQEFDKAAFGLVVSLATAVNQFTFAFGPGLLGVLRDINGGYGAALAACIALWSTAACTILVMRP